MRMIYGDTPAARVSPSPVPRILALAMTVVGCSVTIVAGWPGGISPDMASTLTEARDFAFYGAQSPMFGLAWSLPLAVLPLAVAVGVGYTLQALAYWSTFALLAHASLRHGRRVMALIAALAGFLPPLFGFTVMLESNVQVSAAWGLAITLAYALPGRRTLMVCLPLVFYGYIARYGMIAALTPVLFACLSLARADGPWKRTLRDSLGVTVAFVVVAIGITALLPGPPSRTRVLGVTKLVDLAGVYDSTGTHCIPAAFVPATTTAEAIMAKYDPSLGAALIFDNTPRFQLPESHAPYEALTRCWIDTLSTHPREYLAVKARYALIFLMVGVEWAPATRPDYAANASLGLSIPDHRLTQATKAYIERSRTSIVWKGWFWFLVAAIVVGLAVARRHPHRAAAVALYAGAVGTLIPQVVAGTAALARYYVPTFMILILAMMITAGWPTVRGRVARKRADSIAA